MSKKLWGGRFEKETDDLVEKFTASIDFDKRLYEQDIKGSMAHARMLARAGIIPKEEAAEIIKGLLEIKLEIERGEFPFTCELEDIHMHVESRLFEKIGPVAGKLHTARSRNDQVALDLHLYVKEKIAEVVGKIDELMKVLRKLAAENRDAVMPGYTHLQRAQPVTLSRHLKAYYYMLRRDKERFSKALKGADIMPLGACALAGTTLPIDREYTGELLGFSRIYENTIDAVSDRDFVIEFISCSAILMVHLSRMAEDLILWSTSEFDFIELDDAFATGSSIMPQKKNPDVLELIRGKAGRVFGNLMSVLTVMKGLPLSYNRDMQEDKEPLFDTADTVIGCLKVLPKLLSTMKIKKENMKKAVEESFSDATYYAEYLVKKGMPFRAAHEVVGKMVSYCIKKNKKLSDLSLREFKNFSKLFDEDVLDLSRYPEKVKNKKVL
ncbi:argininosuccinate lyase [Thermosediminibacter oceani]|uniref:Argininosuccinate lyase n=1 Tax=Thermosediminibacter oceani (strain ATCC BAA-1034 / DSM 16646 / JW/IW-1228P) TaxID=555079 RepID=D9S020_THEOJ|nr:argininosuccinate lyase [Thermosediminibacter oceani]ADL06948.1 argininosuccinate lyase [Thermosediminibacter oceani DSM 16646]